MRKKPEHIRHYAKLMTLKGSFRLHSGFKVPIKSSPEKPEESRR